MEDTFDYSQVPYGFGHCAATGCDKAATCLRHIALRYAPEERTFPPTLNPQKLEAMQGKCDYYVSNEPVRYAKGFLRTVNALQVGVADTFRWRLIGRMGRKNYYHSRRGARLISPEEQRYIIGVARELGLQLDDYFDTYVFTYHWQ